ncbi:MAG: hypothetical protein OXR66_05515 [Candidatus Woesearchaeota archaeon]|nr:hypothetical protein [Candidatus Woesearchaeota archaeon]
MPGALTHLGVALIAAGIVHFIHYRTEFSLAIFLGNLLPDALKFGFTAAKQLTLSIFSVEHDSFFHTIAQITGSYTNWFTLGFFLFGTLILLYHFHYIKKKTMEEYDELYVFLLIGIITHLILDALINETGPWF